MQKQSSPTASFPTARSRRAARTGGKSSSAPVTKQQVRQMIRSERGRDEIKYVTTGITLTFASATLQITSVSDIAQGTTDITRIGDKLRPKALSLKLSIVRNPLTSNIVEFVRVCVIQWHPQFSLQPPTATTLFLNDPATATITPFSEWIVDGRSAFVVLFDKLFTMTGLTATTEGALAYFTNVRTTNTPIEFINASATDALHKYYVLYICQTLNVANTTPPTIVLRTKLDFDDQ